MVINPIGEKLIFPPLSYYLNKDTSLKVHSISHWSFCLRICCVVVVATTHRGLALPIYWVELSKVSRELLWRYISLSRYWKSSSSSSPSSEMGRPLAYQNTKMSAFNINWVYHLCCVCLCHFLSFCCYFCCPLLNFIRIKSVNQPLYIDWKLIHLVKTTKQNTQKTTTTTKTTAELLICCKPFLDYYYFWLLCVCVSSASI